ncbi:MAG: ABC transporter ATP-binding protein [Deltaproteobacteria bacterium]|nr:ABC transporter ATP-binding protein [Deltaproteobacteria bacterium]
MERVENGAAGDVVMAIESLSLDLGGRTVLNGVSFDLRRGECLLVLGANGAGKSSLLKCLCKIYNPHAGRILLNGTDIDALTQRELALQVAYLPQQILSGFPFSVYELAMMGRYAHQHSLKADSEEDRAAVIAALTQMDLLQLADRSVQTLSGGERQRALLAACLAQQAPILLLDEPTTFLDPRHQLELREALLMVKKREKLTLMWVTHDINLGVSCADRVIGINAGRICFQGAPDECMRSGALASIYGRDFTLLEHPQTKLGFVVPV